MPEPNPWMYLINQQSWRPISKRSTHSAHPLVPPSARPPRCLAGLAAGWGQWCDGESARDLVVCTWCARTAGELASAAGRGVMVRGHDLRKGDTTAGPDTCWQRVVALTPRVSSVQVRPGPHAEHGLRRMRRSLGGARGWSPGCRRHQRERGVAFVPASLQSCGEVVVGTPMSGLSVGAHAHADDGGSAQALQGCGHVARLACRHGGRRAG